MHAPASQGDGRLRAVDVAMAACAAPAYFPSVRIGRHMYAEGGLFAVAADPVALHELEHFMGVDSGRVSMLSIGQTEGQRGPAWGLRRFVSACSLALSKIKPAADVRASSVQSCACVTPINSLKSALTAALLARALQASRRAGA